MVTQTQARKDIYSKFITDWEAGPDTVKTFDNEKLPTYPEQASWVRFSVQHTASELEAIGGVQDGGFNKYLRRGIAFLQIFTPLDQGPYAADVLVDAFRTIFEGVTLPANQIRFYNVIPREIGPSEAWYQVNVEAVFQYDQRK
jgi:hypothetical protein